MMLRSLTPAQWRFAGGMAILIGCACAPLRPSPPIDRSGSWFGRTSQGGAITFIISSDQRITDLIVEYNFAGCSGAVTMTPNVALANPSGTADAVVTYTPNGPTGPSRTVTHFVFPTGGTANGTVDFTNFGTCGSSSASWNATKR